MQTTKPFQISAEKPKDNLAMMFAGVSLKATAHRAEGWEYRQGKGNLKNTEGNVSSAQTLSHFVHEVSHS